MILQQQDNKMVYSDGSEIEKEILSIAKEHPEGLSQDYIAKNSCYTINNTFSAVRTNILNWYDFKENADILEVGAGMGSLTGMLCDKARTVTTIEMNENRADIIKARYPERKNLTVISEDIFEWETVQRFDYIVFIGVLEYASVFSKSKNPFKKFLNCISNLLKEGGIILFAIENRFGLKYWLGASEDHLQKPDAGIAGYKEKGTPQTFSKDTLAQCLNELGLTNKRFYYVYPDYKFPELICTDELAPSYANMQKISFTYTKGSRLITNEKELYKEIIDNKVWDFFANSFLIEASKEKLSDEYAVYISAKGEVKKEYKVNTVITSSGIVKKLPITLESKNHIETIQANTKSLIDRGIRVLETEVIDECLVSKLYTGIDGQDKFKELLDKNDREGIYALCNSLFDCIRKSSDFTEENVIISSGLGTQDNYGDILSDGYIDMTFYNCFVEGSELIFYDQEWKFSNIPAKFILYYAITNAYQRGDANTGISLQEILQKYDISSKMEDTFKALENFLWSKVMYRQTDFYGEDGYCNRYKEELTAVYQKKESEALVNSLITASDDLKRTVIELNETKESLSRDLLKTQNVVEDLLIKVDDSQKIVDEQKQIVRNKEGHIELLLEVEREFEREKLTKSYRFALKLRRVKALFLPFGSKRRFLAAIIYKFIRHPFRTLGLVKASRIKNAVKIFKSGGIAGIKENFERVETMENDLKHPVINAVEILDVEKSKKIEDYPKLGFKKSEYPDVSIIIPVYNQFGYTYSCLQSILKNSDGIRYEVIIADDCSSDLTTDIEKVVDNIVVIVNKENLRFLKNAKHAAQAAKGKYLIFLNNDTQVQEKWLHSLINTMENDESIGLIGSKLIYSNGLLQEAGGIIWKDGSAWNYGNKKNPEDAEFNYVKEVDFISGAAIMIRKKIWDEVGGFDERFSPAYYEDVDLAFMVRKNGYKVIYQPESVVVHFEGVSNGVDVNSGQKSFQITNLKKFYEKWKEILEREHFDRESNILQARDRSGKKKRILIVDHYVPHFDKDAGSRGTYMYLKLFVDLGLQVTFVGDNFYKHEPYTTKLNQLGIEVLYGKWYMDNWKKWLKENGCLFDYVYLQRPHIAIKYMGDVKKFTNAKIIYYDVDLCHLRELRQYEITKDKALLESAEKWKKIEFSLIEKADVVHVVGSYEEEYLRKIFQNKPIRNIPLFIFDNIRNNVNKNFEQRENILFVGGFGHPPNEDAVVWFAQNIFPAVLERFPNIKWHIVGAKPPDSVLNLADDHILVEGFVTDERLQQLYDQCRISVVPLRFGAGVKGKVLEAVYNQVPLVTSSVGAEGLSKEENAYWIADDIEDMKNLLINLYEDYDALKEKSDNCISFIQNHFMIEHAEQILNRDF